MRYKAFLRLELILVKDEERSEEHESEVRKSHRAGKKVSKSEDRYIGYRQKDDKVYEKLKLRTSGVAGNRPLKITSRNEKLDGLFVPNSMLADKHSEQASHESKQVPPKVKNFLSELLFCGLAKV